eukprot:TRINITY_DN6983_c0_g1_i1.p1 TRINITY_DN6983_c0_g1~~TRINITY_DN6983_c0_g1_i1.p1  ORF type:complete len:143 (+),score=10.21 TRINITY_DN6983_c0_g1_i1:52-429(+)
MLRCCKCQFKGVVAINGWIPSPISLPLEDRTLPKYLLMHGETDDIVDRQLGYQTHVVLQNYRKQKSAITKYMSIMDMLLNQESLQHVGNSCDSGKLMYFKNTGHEVNHEMIRVMRDFIGSCWEEN